MIIKKYIYIVGLVIFGIFLFAYFYFFAHIDSFVDILRTDEESAYPNLVDEKNREFKGIIENMYLF